jgi:hypothetical protein
MQAVQGYQTFISILRLTCVRLLVALALTLVAVARAGSARAASTAAVVLHSTLVSYGGSIKKRDASLVDRGLGQGNLDGESARMYRKVMGGGRVTIVDTGIGCWYGGFEM